MITDEQLSSLEALAKLKSDGCLTGDELSRQKANILVSPMGEAEKPNTNLHEARLMAVVVIALGVALFISTVGQSPMPEPSPALALTTASLWVLTKEQALFSFVLVKVGLAWPGQIRQP
jgi:hypothetical protein